jgi:predicted DNA-binding protein (MmcQ/YjbR family)
LPSREFARVDVKKQPLTIAAAISTVIRLFTCGMNVKQLQKFCLAFPGAAERLWPDPYNILVYAVEDKTFAYFKTSEPEKWRFSFKVTPERFLELTSIPGVKPARYRGRNHWVTVVDVAAFPVGYLKELVGWSHQHALSKLSAKRRHALLGERSR